MAQRPQNLAEAVLQRTETFSVELTIREFLDDYYTSSPDVKQRKLDVEPPLVDDKTNAYVAAVAEQLAIRDKLRIPTWTQEPHRFLHRAWFPCGLESLKATLIKESPIAFRKRLIFVDRDALSRPRQFTKTASR